MKIPERDNMSACASKNTTSIVWILSINRRQLNLNKRICHHTLTVTAIRPNTWSNVCLKHLRFSGTNELTPMDEAHDAASQDINNT